MTDHQPSPPPPDGPLRRSAPERQSARPGRSERRKARRASRQKQHGKPVEGLHRRGSHREGA
ncbi:hypothetical protein [Botrimarina sp.]|uniref:hypothetical protein n=1 Tax=Botrimarina sp. TaxID=2795802 RepID=UPI0032EB9EF7